jgi:hypothetical protein
LRCLKSMNYHRNDRKEDECLDQLESVLLVTLYA